MHHPGKARSIMAATITAITFATQAAHADPETFETSFEFNSGESFFIGETPLTARFTGGQPQVATESSFARSGDRVWQIPGSGTGTVVFDQPADRLELWFRDLPGATRSFVEVFDTSGILVGSRDGSQAFEKLSVARTGTESKIGRVVFSTIGGNDTVIDDFSFTANDEPATSNIIGRLEEPVAGEAHGGVGNLRGWAISPDGIERVDIFIDGSLAFSAPYGGNREDVQDLYPDITDSEHSGFSLAYGYSNLTPGEHTIVARVFSNTGEQQDFTSTFNVVAFDKTFINPGDTVDVGITSFSGSDDEINLQNVSIAGRLYDLKLRWRTSEQGFEIVEIQ